MSEINFLDSFEMPIFKLVQEHQLASVLVAVSGGLDSMSLLHSLMRVATKVKTLKVRCCYVHHGCYDSVGLDSTAEAKVKQDSFRNEAKALVQSFCKDNQIEFLSNSINLPISQGEEAPSSLKVGYADQAPEEKISSFMGKESEQGLRDYRYMVLQQLAKPEECIATGHHIDDLLETRLIRLIRGTGPEGIESMKTWTGSLFRPLLHHSRKQIKNYAKDHQIPYLDDPSNQDTDIMRNWLRNDWLESLESYRPGAVQSLARSLDLVSVSISKNDWVQDYFTDLGVRRSQILQLSREERRQVLASYLHSKAKRDFKNSQLNEVLKRLDTNQKSLTFRVMGLDWVVEPNIIYVS